jgi:hypothetical protein
LSACLRFTLETPIVILRLCRNGNIFCGLLVGEVHDTASGSSQREVEQFVLSAVDLRHPIDGLSTSVSATIGVVVQVVRWGRVPGFLFDKFIFVLYAGGFDGRKLRTENHLLA